MYMYYMYICTSHGSNNLRTYRIPVAIISIASLGCQFYVTHTVALLLHSRLALQDCRQRAQKASGRGPVRELRDLRGSSPSLGVNGAFMIAAG